MESQSELLPSTSSNPPMECDEELAEKSVTPPPTPSERKKKNLGYYFRLAVAKSTVINSIQRQRESKDTADGDLGEVSRKTKKLSQKFNSSLQMPRGIKSDQAESGKRKLIKKNSVK